MTETHRETLEIESQCHKALQDSPVAHARIAEAIDAALAEIDRLRDVIRTIAGFVPAGAWQRQELEAAMKRTF